LEGGSKSIGEFHTEHTIYVAIGANEDEEIVLVKGENIEIVLD